MNLIRPLLVVALVLLLSNTASANVNIDSAVNQVRIQNGLGSLITDPLLESIAQQRAVELSANFDHQSWYYGSIGCWEWTSENIALDFSSSTDWVSLWMSSTLHRASILDPRSTHQGSATYSDPATGITYAVQIFKDSCDQAPPAPVPTQAAPVQITEAPVRLLPNTSTTP